MKSEIFWNLTISAGILSSLVIFSHERGPKVIGLFIFALFVTAAAYRSRKGGA